MGETSPLKRAAEKITGTLQSNGGGPEEGIPGKPGSESPSVSEPTEPQEPLPPKADQAGPNTVSPTGQSTGADQARMARSGAYLTTAQGARLYDTDHSLKAGPRSPVLLQDHHLPLLSQRRTREWHCCCPRSSDTARPSAPGRVERGHSRLPVYRPTHQACSSVTAARPSRSN